MDALREELGRAPRSSRKYTVNEAVAAWLAEGLPGRSERTKNAYEEALTPLLAKIGVRPLRELTAFEIRKGLESLSSRYSTRYLQIGGNSLERAIRFAQVHERVSRNVAELIEFPKGKTGRPSKSLTLRASRQVHSQRRRSDNRATCVQHLTSAECCHENFLLVRCRNPGICLSLQPLGQTCAAQGLEVRRSQTACRAERPYTRSAAGTGQVSPACISSPAASEKGGAASAGDRRAC